MRKVVLLTMIVLVPSLKAQSINIANQSITIGMSQSDLLTALPSLQEIAGWSNCTYWTMPSLVFVELCDGQLQYVSVGKFGLTDTEILASLNLVNNMENCSFVNSGNNSIRISCEQGGISLVKLFDHWIFGQWLGTWKGN